MNKEYLIYKLSDEVKNSCKIDKEAFKKFNVKRGLRNEDGSGVLVGLTNIGNVVGYERDADGKLCPTEGKLYYRGYELDDLVTPLLKEKRFGFEEVAFLLLSGQLPDKEELDAFKELLNDNMPLDHRTITHIIELEGSNIMNILARCVLEMYTFDTFTVRVTSSTRTDTYSSIAAGIGSLKGPLHGGANIKVINMFHHLKEAIKDWKNVQELDIYLKRMLNKEAYDKTGLIYGIGHAVYTLSDPRAVELKKLAGELAKEKGREDEYEFLKLIEQEGIKCLQEHRGGSKPACANLDFYSGFIYEMIGLPQEIYTPIFAMARIVGWTAHRIEELNFEGRRIIRPAYKNILGELDYTPIDER